MLLSPKNFGPTMILLAVIVAYALCFTVVKVGLTYMPPLLFAGLRALVGGLAILAIFPSLKLSWRPQRKLWPWIVGIAVGATTINYAAMFLSPEQTSVGIASVLGNIQPLFVMVLAVFFLGERLSQITLLVLTLGLIGVILVASPSFAANGLAGLSGPGLAAVASASAALGVVLIKRMREPLAVLPVTAWQLIAGSVPLLAYSRATETWPTLAGLADARFLSLFSLLALFATAFSTVAWYGLAQKYDVGKLSLYLFLVPVFGLGIAWLVLGESLDKLEMLGASIIIGAIIILSINHRQMANEDGTLAVTIN